MRVKALFGSLLKNSGYLCEAAAWIVDDVLKLGIVPRTKVVTLAAPTFNYQDREFAEKIGSFQIFVTDMASACTAASKITAHGQPFDEKTFKFLHQFQRMVILDWIIRNTDRSADNWLVNRTNSRLAAIDHGLSFPREHPMKCRSYPFSWQTLPIAAIPFLPEIESEFRKKLSNPKIWVKLESLLVKTFQLDINWDAGIFEEQMSVLRGQLITLASALKAKQSPEKLCRKEPLVLCKQHVLIRRDGRPTGEIKVKLQKQRAALNSGQPSCLGCR